MKLDNGAEPAAVIEHGAQSPLHRRKCCPKKILLADGKCRAPRADAPSWQPSRSTAFHTGLLAARGREDGVTLLEAMVAAALLLIAAIGLMPLFARAALNNVAGADANQATQHARSELDRLLALRFDDGSLDLGNPPPEQTVQDSSAGEGGEEMLLGDVFWDEGAKALIPAETRRHCNLLAGSKARTVDGRLDCIRLGEGGWVASTDDARGLVFWQRRSVIRQFTYADISDGVIDASGSQLVTLGDARLFDRPLAGDAPRSAVHFREQSVELLNERAGGGAVSGRESPDGATLDLGPTSFRSRLVRTF